MGLVVCPKHGRGFIMFVCPHVVTAIFSSTACRGIQHLAYKDPELPEMEWACWFCPECIDENHLPPNGTAMPDLDRLISPLYRPVCPGCFKDWQGQGLG